MNVSENARKVLIAAYENMLDCTGGDFGHADEVEVEGIEASSMGGLFASLNNHGLIYSDSDPEYGYQTSPTAMGLAYLEYIGADIDTSSFDVYEDELISARATLKAIKS